ncbi:hypothetical protein VB773_01890 [Haloarculaceae archaeon H-GB2-1]|nr:hypothetical protein [Haloarculaceae archaeon H-GB1-1]MEA5388417.1 hypothetical protein [Haloarculaceae archaeon H-GB11]MEA5406454.1 hypothetical protein [Haloarculaceae archaeon H-GB2-1]
MGLSDIAAGIEVVEEQRERGVATVDRTNGDLQDRLAPFADRLPCSCEQATALVEAYAEGRAIGASARAVGLSPMTAAKTLHRFGEHVTPLGPTGRELIRDWLGGDLSRSDARTLSGATEREFALAVYVETHESIPEAREAVEGAFTSADDATVTKRERLAETMSDVGELR